MNDTRDKEDTGRNSVFAIMWDCYGLEAVIKVPDSADTTFALLKGAKPPKPPNINHWALRARFNPQRNYEIYIFDSEHGIEREDIVKMFESDPQHAADTIRRLGHCYHSDRATQKSVII